MGAGPPVVVTLGSILGGGINGTIVTSRPDLDFSNLFSTSLPSSFMLIVGELALRSRDILFGIR